jgi:short-subunit dehydrogenase
LERRKERSAADTDETTILITGATDGLGRRVARDLAASGATVLLHGRDEERVETTVREIREETTTISSVATGPTSPHSARCAGWPKR